MRIAEGARVTLHFSLCLADGQEIDGTGDGAPATFVVGDGSLPGGFERALFGLEAGAAGYHLKDIGEDDLVRSIRAVHAGESVLHPKVTRALFESLIAGADGSTGEDESPLTDREDEVLRLAAQGQSNKQIAAHLDVSPRTVQTHLGHIFEKLEVASRTEAVIRGLREGWLLLDEL